jgi:hypothetical protein
MSDLLDALERILAEHRRIGSPVPDYLRPGAATVHVERAVRGALGLEPADELVELFTWHDGIDNDRWAGDSAGTGFARLFGDTHFAPINDCVTAFHEAIEIDRQAAVYAPGDVDASIWQRSWFPAFTLGWETWSVECADTALRGRVYDVYWHPPIDDPKEPRFLSLTHLVRSVVRRFEADGYWWDPSLRFLQERNEVLEGQYRLELAEVQSGLQQR